jgi:hypothetical protein
MAETPPSPRPYAEAAFQRRQRPQGRWANGSTACSRWPAWSADPRLRGRRSITQAQQVPTSRSWSSALLAGEAAEDVRRGWPTCSSRTAV